MSKRIDITGQRFGRLVAILPIGRKPGGHMLWQCQCDCGGTKHVTYSNLRNSSTRSCGCLVKEKQGPLPKHGHARNGNVLRGPVTVDKGLHVTSSDHRQGN